jgi:hypothetical protein
MSRISRAKQGQRKNRQRGRPPLQALGEAAAIAAERGEVVLLPGGRSDAFDLLLCEKVRTVFVRIRRTDLRFTYALEVLDKYRYDIARSHRLPLTQATAREFWLRLKTGMWQFWLIGADGLFEIRRDGTYNHLATLPVPVKDAAAGKEQEN